MPSSSEDHTRRLRIRKYRNRRYYDSTHSRHLTLSQIYEKILEGYEIEVFDSETGQDITPKVLAQIIIDLDPPKLSVFPVAMLHGLLRSNQQWVSDFFDTVFSKPLSAYLETHRAAGQYFRQAMGLETAAPAKQGAAGTRSSEGDLRGMIEELRAEIAELRSAPRRGGGPSTKRRRRRG
jgi:polyhydroxyalkanoate synthesis repressor PhaR